MRAMQTRTAVDAITVLAATVNVTVALAPVVRKTTTALKARVAEARTAKEQAEAIGERRESLAALAPVVEMFPAQLQSMSSDELVEFLGTADLTLLALHADLLVRVLAAQPPSVRVRLLYASNDHLAAGLPIRSAHGEFWINFFTTTYREAIAA